MFHKFVILLNLPSLFWPRLKPPRTKIPVIALLHAAFMRGYGACQPVYDDIFSRIKLSLLVLFFDLTRLNKQFSSQGKIRLYFKVVTTSTSRSVQEDCRLRKRIPFFFPRTLERRAL